MRITREADYAIRMLCRLGLAEADGQAVIGASALADEVAVPPRFGVKILRVLANAELVKTTRGVSGGYSLAVPTAELTLRRIIEAVDGPVILNRCLAESHDCENNPDKNACRVHHVFDTLNRGLSARLDRVTVEMLIDRDTPLCDILQMLA